jgi:hypothetical protein
VYVFTSIRNRAMNAVSIAVHLGVFSGIALGALVIILLA